VRKLEEKPRSPEEQATLAAFRGELSEAERDVADARAKFVEIGTEIRWTVFAYLAAGVLGETTALGALAADESRTALFMLTAESLFVMLFLLMINFGRRFRA
jgi:hypothetical protein